MIPWHRIHLRGGNFAYVAENVSVIYTLLRNTQFGSSLPEGQLMYATALIDTMAYLSSGKITKSDLEIGILSALGNRINVSFYKREIYDYYSERENAKLVCLAMQIEALVFNADNSLRIDYRQIVDMVCKKKTLIEKTVDRIVKQPQKAISYTQYSGVVEKMSEDRSFQAEVLAFRDKL